MPPKSFPFEDRLKSVEERIEAAVRRSGRARSEVKLVAVSKKFSASAIRQAYDAGLRDFGENYVQEFVGKWPELSDLSDARFHLIGHLQSNKARMACELFSVIQTADTPKLLQRLDTGAKELDRQVEVLLEIKLSEEPAKTGADAREIPDLLEAAHSCANLKVTGLMTMPPWSEDAERSRPYFRRLAELARKYQLGNLSMGMSNDFEVAIEEGATLIRVGTALFGKRPPPKEPVSPV